MPYGLTNWAIKDFREPGYYDMQMADENPGMD